MYSVLDYAGSQWVFERTQNNCNFIQMARLCWPGWLVTLRGLWHTDITEYHTMLYVRVFSVQLLLLRRKSGESVKK